MRKQEIKQLREGFGESTYILDELLLGESYQNLWSLSDNDLVNEFKYLNESETNLTNLRKQFDLIVPFSEGYDPNYEKNMHVISRLKRLILDECFERGISIEDNIKNSQLENRFGNYFDKEELGGFKYWELN